MISDDDAMQLCPGTLILWGNVYIAVCVQVKPFSVSHLLPCRWKWIFSMRVFSTIRPLWTTIYFATLLILVVLFVGKFSRDVIMTFTQLGCCI